MKIRTSFVSNSSSSSFCILVDKDELAKLKLSPLERVTLEYFTVKPGQRGTINLLGGTTLIAGYVSTEDYDCDLEIYNEAMNTEYTYKDDKNCEFSMKSYEAFESLMTKLKKIADLYYDEGR